MRNDRFFANRAWAFPKGRKAGVECAAVHVMSDAPARRPGYGVGRLVTFETEDRERREVFVRADHLNVRPYKVVAELADLGLCVSQARGARRRVIEFLIDSGEPP